MARSPTTILMKGEEKGKKQNRCYYGADGKVQKIPIEQQAPDQDTERGKRRGGRVKEKIVMR